MASQATLRGGSRYDDNRTRKKRPYKKRSFNFLPILLIILILAFACAGGAFLLYRNMDQVPDVTIDLSSLDSPYAVLMDQKSGTVLGEKNKDEIIFPASMTKIMTVYTALDYIKNLNETITISYDYWDELYERDATRAGYEPGEEAVISDLLYGALLPSGAECCMELAYQAAGSESAFVELMNQKVSKLGLSQTHFTNCTGLHDDDQYSTVEEIALILKAALNNKTFYEVFTSAYHTMPATDIHPDGFTVQSSMFKKLDTAEVTGGKIIGGKTGYTDEAGYCLASAAQIDERIYILVTAGWADVDYTTYNINDAVQGYDLLGQALN